MPVTDYLRPNTLTRAHGYSHVVLCEGSKAVEIGGQISVDSKGELQHPGDYAGQAEFTMRNVIRAAEAAGASLGDVAKLGIYIVDYSPEVGDQVFAGFGKAVTDAGLRVPAMAVLGISALAFEGALIEIDARAYLT
jgi:enamine deaminase RidA (YjgF/YER057c/UK114 family)